MPRPIPKIAGSVNPLTKGQAPAEGGAIPPKMRDPKAGRQARLAMRELARKKAMEKGHY